MTAELTLSGVVPEWTTGDRLRKAREVAGLSQTEMAEQIGISRGSVGHYESGRYTPSRPVFIAWALRTGVELAWLQGENTPNTAGQTVYEQRPGIPAGMSGQPEPGYAEVTSARELFRKRLPLSTQLFGLLRAVA